MSKKVNGTENLRYKGATAFSSSGETSTFGLLHKYIIKKYFSLWWRMESQG